MLAVSVSVGITDEHLQQVYSDPRIAKVGHDHRPAAPVIHPAATYLSAWIGDQFAGAFLAIRYSPVEIELHSLLLRSAVTRSRDLGAACIDWAFSHPILRVTAYVIDGLESARNFCLKLGFREEGRRRMACVQGGNPKDIHILGITRGEWSKS